MAERVMKTPDFPNFDVYPNSAPRADRELPEHASRARGGDRLMETAATIGEAVGSAVYRMQHMQRQVQELRDRFIVIRGRGAENALESAARLKQTAVERAAQLKDAAADRAAHLKNAAGEQVRQARARAERVVHDYPLQVIAGAAAVGLMAGISLRLWRGRHE